MNQYDAIIIGARCGGAPLAMLLAKSGHKVLLVDKMGFGTGIMSTHYVKRTGAALLSEWGLLEAVKAVGTPAIYTQNFQIDDIHLRGVAPPCGDVGTSEYDARQFTLLKPMFDYTVHLAMLQPLPEDVADMLSMIADNPDAISAFIGTFLGSAPLDQVFPPHIMALFAADVVRGQEEKRHAA